MLNSVAAAFERGDGEVVTVSLIDGFDPVTGGADDGL